MKRDEGGLHAVPLPAGWDQAVRLDEDPATIPDPAQVEVPEELRAEIEAHMAKYPDRHSATLPALGAAQRVHGWCSPEAIQQVAAVMQVTPAYLSSVATFYDMLRTSPAGSHYVYVCTSVACHLRDAKGVFDAVAEEARAQGLQDFEVRMPGRLRHGPDGVDRRPLRGAAQHRRRARAGGCPERGPATVPGPGAG